eukprot:1159916-Pelagomonas_calceolata.AAC.5
MNAPTCCHRGCSQQSCWAPSSGGAQRGRKGTLEQAHLASRLPPATVPPYPDLHIRGARRDGMWVGGEKWGAWRGLGGLEVN